MINFTFTNKDFSNNISVFRPKRSRWSIFNDRINILTTEILTWSSLNRKKGDIIEYIILICVLSCWCFGGWRTEAAQSEIVCGSNLPLWSVSHIRAEIYFRAAGLHNGFSIDPGSSLPTFIAPRQQLVVIFIIFII